jgi:hypothetical protein
MNDDYAFDNIISPMYLPCGGTAYWDDGSGCSHRCGDCMATVGSVGMPRACKHEMDKYDVVLPALGSKIYWDYNEGCEKTK